MIWKASRWEKTLAKHSQTPASLFLAWRFDLYPKVFLKGYERRSKVWQFCTTNWLFCSVTTYTKVLEKQANFTHAEQLSSLQNCRTLNRLSYPLRKTLGKVETSGQKQTCWCLWVLCQGFLPACLSNHLLEVRMANQRSAQSPHTQKF